MDHGERTGIRTPDTRLRRALLYPAELCTHIIYWLSKVVRMKGVEPPRRRRQILSLVRLPIPPHPHFTLYIVGGGWWIRTTESNANRFTVCPLWPLGKSSTLELVIGIEPTTC